MDNLYFIYVVMVFLLIIGIRVGYLWGVYSSNKKFVGQLRADFEKKYYDNFVKHFEEQVKERSEERALEIISWLSIEDLEFLMETKKNANNLKENKYENINSSRHAK